MMKLILMILFVVVTAISTYAQGNGLENGRVYTGYQVRAYGIEKWGAAFPAHQYDATKHYTYLAQTNQFEEYCPTCPTTVVTPPPVTPQGCSDCISVDQALRLVAEQRLMAETILRYQQSSVGGQNGRMSQEEFYLTNRQLDIMEETARAQKRQGRWGIALNTLMGAAGIGMQTWNNLLVRQGYYRSNLSTVTNVINQGGGYTPTDGPQIPGGGGGTTYNPGDGSYVANWGQGTNNSTGGTGYYYNPGDGSSSGSGSYVYNGGNNSTSTGTGNYAYYGNSGTYTNYNNQGGYSNPTGTSGAYTNYGMGNNSSSGGNYVANW